MSSIYGYLAVAAILALVLLLQEQPAPRPPAGPVVVTSLAGAPAADAPAGHSGNELFIVGYPRDARSFLHAFLREGGRVVVAGRGGLFAFRDGTYIRLGYRPQGIVREAGDMVLRILPPLPAGTTRVFLVWPKLVWNRIRAKVRSIAAGEKLVRVEFYVEENRIQARRLR
ncbi:MAG: hypothetical protein D6704_04755 [Nitrospirae bacterium]|nr:MAG: hypothetical protein D6704_04755 [Nitrospirota bacterium]